MPQSEPQWLAFLTRADETFYGGAAGGGKSDLLIGMAVECHKKSVLFRRVYPNLKELISRSSEIIGDAAAENKSEHIWNFPDGRKIEFGAVQYEADKKNWQGRAHDLIGFDEITEFTKSQYEFIGGWNRTTDTGQRVRILATGNPPTDDAGNWIIERWGAWLDDKHPNPANPGELRWYAAIDGNETEVKDGSPIERNGETIYPRSRTFIPARLDDNPYLSRDNRYRSMLQSLPEPLRSQLLNGDFRASAIPDPWQVIPTDWVRAAQARWLANEKPDTPLTAVGIDPARGGRDNMSMARRHDSWFDEIIFWPGSAVPTGPIGAELVRQSIGDTEPGVVNVGVAGVGSSTFDSLKPMYNRVNPINEASASTYRDKSGMLKMRNARAEMYWRMRDALDPNGGEGVSLPPGNEIVADLCSAHYTVSAAGVLIEDKDEIKKRIGRSPDKGESILFANMPASDGWLTFYQGLSKPPEATNEQKANL